MAFANSSVTDIIASTIQERSREFADNFTNNNGILRVLSEKGNIRTWSGGNVILEEIAYTDPSTINANSYSGYEVINISPNSPLSAAQYSPAQYAGSVSMSGLEDLQNSGPEQMIDMLEARIKVSWGQLRNRMDYDLYQDGTGNGGKNLTGLAAAIPDTPTTGTYGGISRSTWAFWQPVKYSGVTNGGAAVSQANIIQYMTALGLQLVRGSDKTDTIIADNTYYALYANALQSIQRITSDTDAASGFANLSFTGGGMRARVVLGGGVSGAVSSTQSTSGATSAHMWFLNDSAGHTLH